MADYTVYKTDTGEIVATYSLEGLSSIDDNVGDDESYISGRYLPGYYTINSEGVAVAVDTAPEDIDYYDPDSLI